MPTTSDSKSELMTTQEVADACRVTPSTVARWAKSGVLTGIAIGPRTLRFRRVDVEALLQSPEAVS